MVMIFSSEGIKAGMKKVCTLVAAAFIAAFVYASWQNNDIVLSEYTYESDKIGPEFDGFKIVQVSDLHSKMFGEHSSILLSMIKEQSPDIIVVTGDMVDERHRGFDTTLEFTREAVKIAPVYFVTGNHEELLAPIKREAFISGMTEAGAVFLNNETVYITRGGERISLSGIRDCDLYSAYLWDIVPKNGGMAILLSHRPSLPQITPRQEPILPSADTPTADSSGFRLSAESLPRIRVCFPSTPREYTTSARALPL